MKSRSWCFTDNECVLGTWADVWASGICRYLVFGREVAPSTGQVHLQGYLYLHNAMPMSVLKKKVHPSAHWEVARGTPSQAADYCKKDGDVTEHGELPTQGKRSDLDEISSLVKAKTPMDQIADLYPGSYIRYHRGIQALSHLQVPRRTWSMEVYWFHGPPGSGKTRQAWDMAGADAYTKPSSTAFW